MGKMIILLLLNGLQQTLMFVVVQDGLKWVMDMAPHVSTVTMIGLLMMAMIFLTMMGMILRVVGMVMALVLSLTMMGMVPTIAMVPTMAMVLMMIAMVPHVHLTVAKAMVHLIVTTAIVQSEVMFHDLPMVDSVPKCVTCMLGRTVSVWVIMTRCSPGMVGGTVMLELLRKTDRSGAL